MRPTARPSDWDPLREMIWSIGNGTNEQQLCQTLASFFNTLCPLANIVDPELCVDYKSAYTARCGEGAFRFAGQGTFLYLTLSLLIVLGTALLLRYRRVTWIPDSAVTIAVGWFTGALLLLDQNPNARSRRRFDEQVFFDVLLPFIIFEAGYNMNRRAMRQRLGLVLALAVVGTAVAFFVTTGLMLGFARAAGRELPLLDAAIFSALISSTDPVAVLGIFAQFGVPESLHTLIFGESTLNDVVAVALYGSLKWAFKNPHLSRNAKIEHLAWSFVSVSTGSIIVGLCCGLAVALAWKRSRLFVVHPVLETLTYLLAALVPYYIADALAWSGVIAILFAALTMSAFAHGALSKQSALHVTFVVECLSRLFEASIFGYLGTQMVINSERLVWTPLAMAALFSVLLARAVSVFPILTAGNLLSSASNQVPVAHQCVVWFSGLRGALAFALAVTIPEYDQVTKLGSHWSGEILAWTTLIIVVNVFCFGASTGAVLKLAGVACDPAVSPPHGHGDDDAAAEHWTDRLVARITHLLASPSVREAGDLTVVMEDNDDDDDDEDFVHVNLASRLVMNHPVLSPARAGLLDDSRDTQNDDGA